MSRGSVIHSTFTLQRAFSATPRDVFHAWSSADAKKRWFACDEAMVAREYSLDFRVGGREVNRLIDANGVVHLFQGSYFDIVPDRRIIYAYDMHVGATRITVSLATIAFEMQGSGTRLIVTEQIAFLDGNEDKEGRIRGTEIWLDRLVQRMREASH